MDADPIHLFSHLCCRMYRLKESSDGETMITIHVITDTQTDGQTNDCMMTIADHTA